MRSATGTRAISGLLPQLWIVPGAVERVHSTAERRELGHAQELERLPEAEIVPPAMVLAHEPPGVAARLVTGRAFPNRPVAPMPAHVVEGPDSAVQVS